MHPSTKTKLSRKQKKRLMKEKSTLYMITRNHKVIPLGHIFFDAHFNSRRLRKWGKFLYDSDRRRVLLTTFDDGTYVSTVFLGLNHRFLYDGPPLVFETMVFGGEMDREQWRYSTYKQARKGHFRAVALAKGVESGKVELYDRDR